MSDRIQRIIEAGERLRQFDIELGVMQERKRIVALVKEVWESRCSPVMEPDECTVCWLVSSIIEKIEEEGANE